MKLSALAPVSPRVRERGWTAPLYGATGQHLDGCAPVGREQLQHDAGVSKSQQWRVEFGRRHQHRARL